MNAEQFQKDAEALVRQYEGKCPSWKKMPPEFFVRLESFHRKDGNYLGLLSATVDRDRLYLVQYDGQENTMSLTAYRAVGELTREDDVLGCGCP